MYICIYIYIYVCVFVNIFMHIYSFLYVYSHVYVDTHISIHTYTNTYMYRSTSGHQLCKQLSRIFAHNTLHHTATHCNTLQLTATPCNTLQHIATHCNTLQHTATHCNTLQIDKRASASAATVFDSQSPTHVKQVTHFVCRESEEVRGWTCRVRQLRGGGWGGRACVRRIRVLLNEHCPYENCPSHTLCC